MPPTRTLRPPTTHHRNGDGNDVGATRPNTTTAIPHRLAGRNRNRIVGGVLLMATSALLAALVYASLGDRQTVLTVTGPVTAGEVIEPGDLGEALVSTDVAGATVPVERRDEIVGRTAAVDLVTGSFLADQHVADAPVASSGEAIVGAVLKPGSFPLDLRRGDRVIAVLVPSENVETGGRPTPSTPATVVAVQEQPDSGGSVAVSLAVPPDDAGDLSIGGAQGRITLVLAPR